MLTVYPVQCFIQGFLLGKELFGESVSSMYTTITDCDVLARTKIEIHLCNRLRNKILNLLVIFELKAKP